MDVISYVKKFIRIGSGLRLLFRAVAHVFVDSVS